MTTESLPAIITRAGQRLLDARTSGEVLEAKKLAEAALHYARVTGAANESHADILRIITRAEIIMANEIDRGQAGGEVARQGRPKKDPDSGSFSELGVSPQRVSEWREVRDAGEQVVEGVIGRALAAGRAPTKSEVLQAAREIKAERQAEKAERRIDRERDLAAATNAAAEGIGHQIYNVILADPPWRFEPYSRETGMDRAADNHYPTATLDSIKALDVEAAAADDCVLFMWATAPMLREALDVMDAWGFEYRTHVVWGKDRIGTGYWARNKHELLLIGVRGSVPAPSPGTQPDSLIMAPVGRHSQKPEDFHQIIERMFPTVPKLEMFARAERHGWDVWGNEAQRFEAAE